MIILPGCGRRTSAWAIFAGALLWAATATGASGAGLVGARAVHSATTAAAARAPEKSVATASAVRVVNKGGVSTLVFDLSAPVAARAFVMSSPDRAIVDLPQVDFEIDPALGRAQATRTQAGRAPRGHAGRHDDPVSSFRFGLLSPGRSRIVVDLASPAKISVAEARRVGDRYELAIVLARTDREAFRAAAQAGNLDAGASTNVPQAATSPAAANLTTIVLDPGHGGPDTGAIVNGVIEKDVALAFARALAAKLRTHGGFNVVLTRSDDLFVPLSERVRIARETGAALMVSIHADTLTDAADVSGATVYTVSDRASDAYAAKVAAKENEVDATAGVDGRQDRAEVNDILFDLTRQETRAYSHVFARTLVNYWKIAGRLNKNPRRAAGFVVLKAPDVPSVLLELGYLSSPVDSAELTSDIWREQATGRMAEAIVSYFADRQGAAKAAAGVPMPLPQATAALHR